MTTPGKPDNTRPIQAIKDKGAPPPRGVNTVTGLFLDGEGDKKVSLIEADVPLGPSPDEIRKERLRRKSQARSEKLSEESDIAEGIARVRKTTLYIIGVLMVVFACWRVNVVYQGNWPLMLTWLVMAVVMLAGFGWLFWYLGNSD